MSHCKCFQIGGPFMGADPNCHEHGTDAQTQQEIRETTTAQLRERAKAATTMEELQLVVAEALNIIENL